MLVLGDINKGYKPAANDYVLNDGRAVGPFESAHAVQLFAKWFGSKAKNLFTAKELFEGTVGGEEYRLVRTDEVSLETHPFQTIYDIWTTADNGNVVFEMPRGFSVVDPRRLVLIDCPEPCSKKATLNAPVEPPRWIDLENHTRAEHVVKSRHHGEIAVFWAGSKYMVGWRHDGRQSKDIAAISLHSHLRTAEKAANERALDFIPPQAKKKNRPRDSQRERLYFWEHSFASDFQKFGDLSEAEALAHRICDDLGVRRVNVSLGRPTLVERSYYKAGDVVLSRNMLNNHTLVHEVAHHICKLARFPNETSHGPSFAGVLLSLMKEYMSADLDEALVTARERDIVVNLDALNRITAKLTANRPSLETQTALRPA